MIENISTKLATHIKQEAYAVPLNINIKIIRLLNIFVLPWKRLHIKDIFANMVSGA